MPFKLSDYDRAFGLFMQDSLRELAVAGDPILSQIPFEKSTGPLGSVIQDQEGRDVDLPPGAIVSETTMSLDAVREGDVETFVIELDKASAQVRDGYARGLFSALRSVTSATGNVTRANGPLTFEVMYEMLDRREWTLTEDDELSMPSFVGAPGTRSLQLTPEQGARLAALHERKLRELLARRRRRRLS